MSYWWLDERGLEPLNLKGNGLASHRINHSAIRPQKLMGGGRNRTYTTEL